LTFLIETKVVFKECCLVFHQTRYAVSSIRIEVLEFQTQSLIFVLTQSKLSLAARFALNLYECAISASNADFNSMNF